MNSGPYSPLRYPGGKAKLAWYFKQLVQTNDLIDCSYIEPFAGGAGISWDLLINEYARQVYINDLDIAVYSFWQTLIQQPKELTYRLRNTRVTVAEWDRQKRIYQTSHGHNSQTKIRK